MSTRNIAQALQRVREVLTRRPQAGIHADEPAVAHWDAGLRVVCGHPNGTQISTDMPGELGGTQNQISPGWLLRAGMASCLATRIAMEAATAGIALSRLEVLARSTSDARGLLGIRGQADEPVTPAPHDVQLEVRVAAADVARDQLQAMIEHSFRCSPVSAAVAGAVPVGLHVAIEPD
jgi:uncharacterized OsmC-like protein